MNKARMTRRLCGRDLTRSDVLAFGIGILLALSLPRPCTAEVKIPGVPDYLQNDFAGTNDCAPVASGDVLGYWDANGYDSLIAGSSDFAANPAGVTALVDKLKTYMLWTPFGTQVEWIWVGIVRTATDRGCAFAARNFYTVLWTDIKAEIDAGCPSAFTFYHTRYGSLHTAACLGYDEPSGARVVILHDNWYPPSDVHVNFAECSSLFLTSVRPVVYYVGPSSGGTEDGSLAHPFRTIQKAVDAAYDGVRVIVLDGTYTGQGNRDIDFKGKKILLRSQRGPTNCVLNCEGTSSAPHRAFLFHTGEGSSSIVEGFTMKNGYAADGGAIWCSGASPAIRSCVIIGNTAQRGGGVFCTDASPSLDRCTIAGNSASTGGGLCSIGSGTPSATSSIFWSNTGGEISPSNLDVKYCDVAGGYPGTGSIAADPLLASIGAGDCHLMSMFGRWSPQAGGTGRWVYDDVTSPCIDAGDPLADFSKETQPNGGRLELGAFGNSPEASKSGTWWDLRGDVNDDCAVNVLDLLFVRNRLSQDAGTGSNWKADVNGDGHINVLDLITIRNQLNTRCSL